MQSPPSHDGVRAAVAYGEVARTVAVRLKHGRRIGNAGIMADALSRHVRDGDAVLVPVPLHRWRLWRRGFNQSALIAEKLVQLKGNRKRTDWLVRKRATPMLGGLGAKERAKALQGAIAIPPAVRADIRDKFIYLIDDVYTSGATANACARALKRAGAARVEILCWARVLKDDDQG